MTLSFQKIITTIPCQLDETDLFRRKIGQMHRANEYLHNHDNRNNENKYHHRYPLVQYRSVKGCLEIVAFNEAIYSLTEIINNNTLLQIDFNKNKNFTVKLFPTKTPIIKQIEVALPNKAPRKPIAREQQELYFYRLENVILYSKVQYDVYENFFSFFEKINYLTTLIQHSLVALIQSLVVENAFVKVADVRVTIIDIKENKKILNMYAKNDIEKKIKLGCQTLQFACNVLLPAELAIGHAVAYGHGLIIQDNI
jgi:Cas6b N-terminal domain